MKKSIAWGIAEKISSCGAELAFSYVNDSIKRVTPLAGQCNSNLIYECDVTSESSIDNFFKNISKKWESFDFLVHSIAFSDKKSVKR